MCGCNPTRCASMYMSRMSYHQHMVARDRNHVSSKKMKVQTWISYPPSLIHFIFQCWFHPFHHALAFWYECMKGSAASDTCLWCLTYIVHIDPKVRHSSTQLTHKQHKNVSNLAPASARLWIITSMASQHSATEEFFEGVMCLQEGFHDALSCGIFFVNMLKPLVSESVVHVCNFVRWPTTYIWCIEVWMHFSDQVIICVFAQHPQQQSEVDVDLEQYP